MPKISTRLIVVVVMLLFFLGAFHTALNSRFAHKIYLGFLERTTGWEITAENIYVGLFRGRVKIDYLSVKSPDQNHAAVVRSVFIRFSPLSVIRGKIVIGKLEIDRLQGNISGSIERESDVSLDRRLENLVLKLQSSFWANRIDVSDGSIKDVRILFGDGGKFQVGEMTFGLKQTILGKIVWNLLLNDLEYEGKGKRGAAQSFRFLGSIESGTNQKSPWKVVGETVVEGNSFTWQRAIFNKLNIDLKLGEESLNLRKFGFKNDKVELDLQGELSGLPIEKSKARITGKVFFPTVLKSPLIVQSDYQLEGDLVMIPKLDVRMDDAEFSSSGQLSLSTKEYDLKYEAKNLPLNAIFGKMSSVVLKHAEGMSTVKGVLKGKIPGLSTEAVVTFDSFRHRVIAGERVEGTVLLNWPHLEYTAQVFDNGKSSWSSSGGMNFLPGGEDKSLQTFVDTIHINFNNADLQRLLPGKKYYGGLTGHLILKGDGLDLYGEGRAIVENVRLGPFIFEKLSSEIKFEPKRMLFINTHLEFPDLTPITFGKPVIFNFKDEGMEIAGNPLEGLLLNSILEQKTGRFLIREFKYQKEPDNIAVNGYIDPDGAISIAAKGGVNLKYLRALKTVFNDLEGDADIDLKVYGTLPQISGNGHLIFKGDSIDFRGLDYPINNINGTLLFKEMVVFFEGMTGEVGDGTFRMDGDVSFDKVRPHLFNIRLKGERIPYVQRGKLRLEADCDLSLKGTYPSPLLSGDVDIIDGRYYQEFKVSELVLKPLMVEVEEESEFSRATGSFRLDLKVTNRGDLRIKNNIADVYLRSQLLVKGVRERMRVEGTLETYEGGTLRYLGRDFEITKGVVEFTDPHRVRPYLTLHAQHDLIDIDDVVFVKIEGYLDNLKVAELFSHTEKDRNEAQCLLISGMSCRKWRRIGRSEDLAARFLAEEVSGIVGGPISGIMHVDTFKLEASEAEETTISKVRVGKRITDRLSFEVTNDFAPASAERSVSSKYFLTDQLFFEGETGQNKDFERHYRLNVSLRFKMR